MAILCYVWCTFFCKISIKCDFTSIGFYFSFFFTGGKTLWFLSVSGDDILMQVVKSTLRPNLGLYVTYCFIYLPFVAFYIFVVIVSLVKAFFLFADQRLSVVSLKGISIKMTSCNSSWWRLKLVSLAGARCSSYKDCKFIRSLLVREWSWRDPIVVLRPRVNARISHQLPGNLNSGRHVSARVTREMDDGFFGEVREFALSGTRVDWLMRSASGWWASITHGVLGL